MKRLLLLIACVSCTLYMSGAVIDEVQEVTRDDLCAKDDTDMRQLYLENMEQDFFYWDFKLNGTKLKVERFIELVDSYETRNEQQGQAEWISSEHNVVLIKDNKFYFPFRPFEFKVDCFKKDTWCADRMKWTQWSFTHWAEKLGFKFPDVVFFYETGDAGTCTHPHHRPCPAPMFTYFKQRYEPGVDMQFPDNEDFTLLMPSLYSDLERDIVNDDVKPYTMYNYPWHMKQNKGFFRGSGWCPTWHHNRVSTCPRWHHANLSIFLGYGDNLDVMINGWVDPVRKLPPFKPVSLKDHAKYKFLLSFDGVSASNRFAKMLGINSVVLKEDSPYLAHFYRSLKPFEHYIPIMYRHDKDTLDVIEGYKDRDDDLIRIVNNAQRFAATYLCDRAIALYFRKALERYKDLFDDMQGLVDNFIWPLILKKEDMAINYVEANKFTGQYHRRLIEAARRVHQTADRRRNLRGGGR